MLEKTSGWWPLDPKRANFDLNPVEHDDSNYLARFYDTLWNSWN